MSENWQFRLREIALRVGDLNPVVHKECRRPELSAQVHIDIATDYSRNSCTNDKRADGCGGNTPHTAYPEVLQANRAGINEFPKQQGRDEEPTEHEEHVDAQITAGQYVAEKVVNHH